MICGPDTKKKRKEAVSGISDWSIVVDADHFNLEAIVNGLPELVVVDDCPDLRVKYFVDLSAQEMVTIPVDDGSKTIFVPDLVIVVRNWPCQELIRDLKHVSGVDLIVLDIE